LIAVRRLHVGSEETMRAETQAQIDDIKQSLALLRRYL
jgi:hypothetical protein